MIESDEEIESVNSKKSIEVGPEPKNEQEADSNTKVPKIDMNSLFKPKTIETAGKDHKTNSNPVRKTGTTNLKPKIDFSAMMPKNDDGGGGVNPFQELMNAKIKAKMKEYFEKEIKKQKEQMLFL